MKIAVTIIDWFVKERKSKHQDIGYQRTDMCDSKLKHLNKQEANKP